MIISHILLISYIHYVCVHFINIHTLSYTQMTTYTPLQMELRIYVVSYCGHFLSILSYPPTFSALTPWSPTGILYCTFVMDLFPLSSTIMWLYINYTFLKIICFINIGSVSYISFSFIMLCHAFLVGRTWKLIIEITPFNWHKFLLFCGCTIIY